jgi:hypothetical protein
MDDLLLDAQFVRCNETLRAFDIKRLDIDVVIGILTVTLGARDKLPFRKRLVERAERKFVSEVPERVEALLAGLR